MDFIENWNQKLKERLKQMPLRHAMVIFLLFVFLVITTIYFLTARVCDNCITMLQQTYFCNKDYFKYKNYLPYITRPVTDSEKAINKIWLFYFFKKYSLIIYIPIGIYTFTYFFYKEKLKEPLCFLHQGAEHLRKNDLDFSFQYNSRDEMEEICQTFEKMRFQLIENQKEIWKIIEDQRQLNAMFAHDLRTPLTVIRGYLDMLKKYYPLGMSEEKLMEILTILSKQVERMELFSDTMKDLHGMDELTIKKKSANLQNLYQKIEETIQGISTEIPISFHAFLPSKPLFCYFDETIIFEVLDNLISNACRYANAQVNVKAELENELLFIYVKDDGCGFSKYDQKHALDPYYSGSGKAHGHFGLGLTIANKLCHKHGGKLEITNSINGGAITCAIFSIIK